MLSLFPTCPGGGLLLFCMHFDCKIQEFILKFDMSGGATSDAKFIKKRGIWGRMGEVKSCVGYVGETNRHPVIPPVSGLETAEFRYLLGIQRHVNSKTYMYWEQPGHKLPKIR